MKSKFITDLQDPFNGLFDPTWAEVYTNFLPSSADSNGGKSLGNAPVEILATPVLTSEAVESQAAQSGPTTLVALTSGGIIINLLFDAAAMAAPAGFRTGIQQAASILTSAISDKITVNIKIDYSGTGGAAAAGPDSGLYESYTSVRADLINNATPGDISFKALPNGSNIQGQSQVAVWNAQLKLWGLLGANDTTTDDGSATFATDINPNLLVGVALHELTHALGRIPFGSQPDIFDFYRFTGVGTRLFSGSQTAPAAYFSLDGGNTKIADYGQTSDPSDFLNSGVQAPNDPFNEIYTSSTLQQLTSVDLKQLDALGFHADTLGISVVQTATQAIQGGPAIALLSAPPTLGSTLGSILTSSTIKISNASGNPVAGDELYVNGQQSGTVDGGLVTVNWNDTTKTLTLTGNASLADYQTLLSEITYRDNGKDTSTGSHPQHTVSWTINDGTATSGSTTSQVAIERPPVATVTNVSLNPNATTVVASSLFGASDPDGDAITTYAFKDTGNGHFVLNGVVEANNQEIDVTASQLAQLMYQSAGGTDSVQVRVDDGTLWGTWQSFTVTGPTANTIESFGSSALVQVGNNFYLESITSGTGPELKYNGNVVTVGDFGTWTPIGTEQTTTGYDIAWHDPANGVYTVWTADNVGEYTGNVVPVVTGNNTALESIETTFDQDLNGDGTIGIPVPTASVIQTDVNTTLAQVGNIYFLYAVGTTTGPELKYGNPVTTGEFGTWTPIGAVQTATGYDVAWKDPANGVYTVWSTDSAGNYTGNVVPVGPSNSTALESIETTFRQDLSGDGTIGIPTVLIQTDGTTSLAQVGDNFFLYAVGTTTGPELKYSGNGVTTGEFGAWTPIGAVQTAIGYDVAWHDPANGVYTVWTTDSAGNYTSNVVPVLPGNNSALESIETTFQQDLNGDGIIGIPTTLIQTDGNTSLAHVGINYFLYAVGTTTGPELKYAGNPVTTGEFGTWTPIGAVQTATGYDVAWHDSANSVYTVWSTDNVGNYNSNVVGPGNSAAVESIETTFQQDLNGDGIIGIPATTQPAVTQLVGPHSAFPPVQTTNLINASGKEVLIGSSGSDAFVFAPNFAQKSITNFDPNYDTIQIDHTTLTDLAALVAHTSDNSAGNAVIAANAHDTITIMGVTTDTLQHHLNDFIIT